MLRSFLLPFIYCVVGFLGVWLIFELGSHANEFVSSGIPLRGILAYYGGQLPSIALIILPIGLLLALLFCLGRMSTSNELLAMLSTGVSLGRILMPIFVVGLGGDGAEHLPELRARPAGRRPARTRPGADGSRQQARTHEVQPRATCSATAAITGYGTWKKCTPT